MCVISRADPKEGMEAGERSDVVGQPQQFNRLEGDIDELELAAFAEGMAVAVAQNKNITGSASKRLLVYMLDSCAADNNAQLREFMSMPRVFGNRSRRNRKREVVRIRRFVSRYGGYPHDRIVLYFDRIVKEPLLAKVYAKHKG